MGIFSLRPFQFYLVFRQGPVIHSLVVHLLSQGRSHLFCIQIVIMCKILFTVGVGFLNQEFWFLRKELLRHFDNVPRFYGADVKKWKEGSICHWEKFVHFGAPWNTLPHNRFSQRVKKRNPPTRSRDFNCQTERPRSFIFRGNLWSRSYPSRLEVGLLFKIREPMSLSEISDRREGVLVWVRCFDRLRRIVWLFNEKDRKIWPNPAQPQ